MRPTILVVDDEPSVLNVLCGVLASRGYGVAGAGSAEQALEMYAACGPVDLVLTDVVMPQMSGPELADRMWEITPGQRVLFIAGLPDTPVIRTRILDRGLPLLAKPFLPCDLVARVEEVLRSPAPTARSR
jgi:DNA-binding response OmpR family regulator